MCFNPRAREGRDTLRMPSRASHSRFNPRAREGRDIISYSFFVKRKTFQSTRPRGARQDDSQYLYCDSSVSIHAPARGATICPSFRRTYHFVSIHAPARGATADPHGDIHERVVSIHAPARGATRLRLVNPFEIAGFNPRAREGRDAPLPPQTAWKVVSIHAPARGATAILSQASTVFGVSIHAPARGATAEIMRRRRAYGVFQSTRPRGARPRRRARAAQTRHSFNPRAREGRDTSAEKWEGT